MQVTITNFLVSTDIIPLGIFKRVSMFTKMESKNKTTTHSIGDIKRSHLLILFMLSCTKKKIRFTVINLFRGEGYNNIRQPMLKLKAHSGFH